MKILWITNIPLLPLCNELGWEIPASGGWLYSSAKRLKSKNDVQLYVTTINCNITELLDYTIDGIRYFVIPYKGRSQMQNHQFVQDIWKHIYNLIIPDVVHIHGTECAHGNDYIRACGSKNVVLSIQGLVSQIAPYYCVGLNKSMSSFPLTIRDFLKRSTINREALKFRYRGNIEIDTIKRIKHIIGRTQWDHAHTFAINPDCKYYHCDEVLRDSFYNGVWTYKDCVPYTIFISQASYPIKGLHFVLEALPAVIKQFPETQVLVAGPNITKRRPWYKYSSYGKYINNLIKKLKLTSHVKFIGSLNETEMRDQYLNSNLFICPSTIENSPNSLCEAILLRTPSISSFVGGAPDMLDYKAKYLYRVDDVKMLSYLICNVFNEKGDAIMPESLRLHALKRHSPQENIDTIINIYKNIINLSERNG